MRRIPFVLLVVLIAVSIISFGCGSGDTDDSLPDGDSDGDSDSDASDGDADEDNDFANLPDTPVQVQAMLSRTYFASDNTLFMEWSISVANEDTPVNDAVVTVNGITIPRADGFIEGWYVVYNYTVPTATYAAGQTYTVTITWNGATYTQSVDAPGDITISEDGSHVSWGYEGRYAGISVSHVFGETTYSAPYAQPGPLASPQDIPASAYPTPGDYELVAWAENSTDYFDSLHGLGVKTYCVAKDTVTVTVSK